MIKALFSDLDETLLVNHHVPEINRNAIIPLREKNIRFIISTGRSYPMIKTILKEIDLYHKENEYMICNNGAVILENNEHLLRFIGLDRDIALHIIEEGMKLDVCIMIFTLEHLYLIHPDPLEIKRKVNQKAEFTIIESFEDIDEPVSKILFMKLDMDYLKRIEIYMRKIFGDSLEYAYSSFRYIEFNAPHISKGEAILWLCEYLHIPVDETIGIGDNYNDITMIQNCGIGAVVSSATDDIRQYADYICKNDYDEGAVKEVIDVFIGG